MVFRPGSLVLIYDGDCILCRRSARWLNHHRTHVPISTIAAGDPQALAGYGHIPGYGDNMVVVGDNGRFWVGPPDAYLVAMWAVRGTRWMSYVLALPGLRRLATRVFQTVAGNRHLLGNLGRPYCANCMAASNQ